MKATTTKRPSAPRTRRPTAVDRAADEAARALVLAGVPEREFATLADAVRWLGNERAEAIVDRDNARESLGYHDQHAARLASERDEARKTLTRARWVLSVLLSRVQLTSDDLRPGALCDCVDAVMGGRG